MGLMFEWVLFDTADNLWMVHIGNKIGDKGAKALAEGLKENKTLTYLDISSTSSFGDGLMYLDATDNLWMVIIGNRIGDEGAKALSDSLKENKTLKVLDISGTSLFRR